MDELQHPYNEMRDEIRELLMQLPLERRLEMISQIRWELSQIWIDITDVGRRVQGDDCFSVSKN